MVVESSRCSHQRVSHNFAFVWAKLLFTRISILTIAPSSLMISYQVWTNNRSETSAWRSSGGGRAECGNFIWLQALFRKKITHGENHPVETRIKQYLVEYLSSHAEGLINANISRICLYLSLNFPRALSHQFSQFQEKIAQGNVLARLSLKDLITIAAANPQTVSKVGFHNHIGII